MDAKMPSPTLNERAQRLADHIANSAEALRIEVHRTSQDARILDCGIHVPGGLQAGINLARVCLAGQADVTLVPGAVGDVSCPLVQVSSDRPVAACMASQYAGWPIHVGTFFALGSGPMRAHRGKEEVFDKIGHREKAPL